MMKKAIVLLSGGIDSATTLFMAKEKGYQCLPLIFNYGQRHKKELESAKKISRSAGCGYKILKIRFPWKGSSLLDRKNKLPHKRSFKEMKKKVPSTYVPARNAIFLSFALSYAETVGAAKIFIGANAVDFSGYPDCRGVFLKSFERLIRSGTRAGMEGRRISLEAPLLFKSKSQIVKEAKRLGVPYGQTWSCYAGGKDPCGSCDSCVIRDRGFKEAGIKDPLAQ